MGKKKKEKIKSETLKVIEIRKRDRDASERDGGKVSISDPMNCATTK